MADPKKEVSSITIIGLPSANEMGVAIYRACDKIDVEGLICTIRKLLALAEQCARDLKHCQELKRKESKRTDDTDGLETIVDFRESCRGIIERLDGEIKRSIQEEATNAIRSSSLTENDLERFNWADGKIQLAPLTSFLSDAYPRLEHAHFCSIPLEGFNEEEAKAFLERLYTVKLQHHNIRVQISRSATIDVIFYYEPGKGMQ